MSSVSFTRTNGTPTSQKKFTFSIWYKKVLIRDYGASSVDQEFINFATSNDERLSFFINNENSPYNQVRLVGRNGGSQILDLRTDEMLMDVAGWYHIVAKVDTTQSSEADRAKIFLNGIEQTLDTSVRPSQDTTLNVTQNPYLFSYSGSGNYLEGNVAHFHYTDGYAYDASTFGEFDSTSGIWIAKTSPSVTYGTNGFFMKFASGALGTDSSGESNDFVVSGTMTTTKDTPDNNFATINPNYRQFGTEFTSVTNSNTTTLNQSTSSWGTLPATMGVETGKWYAEFKCVTLGVNTVVGVTDIDNNALNDAAAHYIGQGGGIGEGYQNDGNNSRGGASFGDTYTSGDIIGCAVDLTNLKLYFSKNGVWQNSGDPTSGATGTGSMVTLTDDITYTFGVTGYNATVWSCNFGNGYFGTTSSGTTEADDAGIGVFKYDVPAGYYALCTNNLGDQS